ncbi:MAG: tRNA 2-thiouridine(34) synthase MnmA [Parachlamydiaceae bacterium]|nr:tRNA 2-thiouridine(34) synthase MnmA [Parachlamydiaceae bacterium]
MSKAPTVVVGMSGGVDSSLCALLLKEQGYNVIGMFMKNWEERDASGVCPSSLEYEDVVRVCEQIGIPYYSVNFVKEYWDSVFAESLREFQAGNTPNPDILCNREIKFKVFLEKALQLGADYLATGHYCQIRHEAGHRYLLKGNDPGKDQSYFLYTLLESILDKVLFPIGHLHKSEVRELARKNGLSNAEKKDSTGICFIGKRDFKQFLGGYIPPVSGNFEDLNGKIVGKHEGAVYYTIGQRKGMGIGGAGDAWFVVGKDITRNVVIVTQGTDHPALYCDDLVATELSWVSLEGPPVLPFRCRAKVRYRQPDQECCIERIENGYAYVSFSQPQRAVTTRQSIVFYDGDICLGGGMIHTPGPSYHSLRKVLPPPEIQ